MPCIETAEEKQLLPYFCKQLADYSKHEPKMIEVLKQCIHKINTTESGLMFNFNDIDPFKMFLAVFYPLFPAEYWACDLPKSLKYKDLEHMIYIHQIKSKKLIINKRNKSFRIYLKSQKNDKSLSLLKYVIIILSALTPELFKQKNKIDFH